MNKRSLPILLLICVMVFSTSAPAYAEGMSVEEGIRVVGAITHLDPPGKTFTLRTAAGGDVRIHVTGATKFRSAGDGVDGFEDLEVGMRALVRGTEQGDGRIQARLVTVARAKQLPETIRILGKVTGVDRSSSTFGLGVRDGREMRFNVVDRTSFRSRDGSVTSLADLESGMDALVVGAETEEQEWVALIVVAGVFDEIRERTLRVAGEITRVNPGQASFSLETVEGELFVFQVVERTQYRSPDGSVTSIQDLKAGMRALVRAVKSEGGENVALTVTASATVERPARPRIDVRAAGRIVDLGDRSIILEARSGERHTFEVDNHAIYKSRARLVQSFGDLEIGMIAAVAGSTLESGGVLARVVMAGNPSREWPQAQPEIERGAEPVQPDMGDAVRAPEL